MTQIPAEEIITLMFLPITDSKVVEMIDTIGMEQPSLDEEYEMEGRVWTEGEEISGVSICFITPNEYSDDAEPIMQQIDFYKEDRVSFPLGLHKSDNYKTVIKKIGRKPDFCDKGMSWSKKWVFPFRNLEIGIGVNFKQDMKSINNIVVKEFNRKSVKTSEFIFPCNELEK